MAPAHATILPYFKALKIYTENAFCLDCNM